MIKEMFVDLLYPRRCPVCDEVMAQGTGLICGRHKELPYVKMPCCMRCGKEIENDYQEYCHDCFVHERHFIRGFPVFNYIEPIKSSILSVKYHNKREYCDFYSREMAKKLMPYMGLLKVDAIIPVPMYSHKKKARGFNQAEVLAKKLGNILGIAVYSDILTRGRETTPQKELDNLERANNIKNAISVNKIPDGMKNVMIVDDIYTTGATIEACAKRLISAGVEKVYFTTVCIGKGR